jgi:thiol-disulfide isomerase/thioredoxin
MSRWLMALLLAAAALAARAEVGDTVRWTDVPLYDGRTLPASALAGKTVVVEFWATWCPFCKKQNPFVEKLYRQHGKDLVVLTFSIDKTPELVADYMKKGGYSFPVAMAGELSQRLFPKRKGLPVMYVVDRQGRIVYHEAGELFEEDILGLARFAAK